MCNFQYDTFENYLKALVIIEEIGVDHEGDKYAFTIVTDELTSIEYDRMVRLY